MRFLDYINEETNRGVKLEWCIVRLCLLDGGVKPEDIKKRIGSKAFVGPNLFKMAVAAKENVKKYDRKLLPLAQHADELGIKGNPSPKTDILFGRNIRVSVKMSGSYQLSSSMGKTVAETFKEIAKEFIEEKKNDDIFNWTLDVLTTEFGSMPYKNMKNWEEWRMITGDNIEKLLLDFLRKNKEFHIKLIEEALTGKRLFRNNILASANYILFPRKFTEINIPFIEKTLSKTKIAISKKSHKERSWGVIRFRTDEKMSSPDTFSNMTIKNVLTDEMLEKIVDGWEFSVDIEFD